MDDCDQIQNICDELLKSNQSLNAQTSEPQGEGNSEQRVNEQSSVINNTTHISSNHHSFYNQNNESHIEEQSSEVQTSRSLLNTLQENYKVLQSKLIIDDTIEIYEILSHLQIIVDSQTVMSGYIRLTSDGLWQELAKIDGDSSCEYVDHEINDVHSFKAFCESINNRFVQSINLIVTTISYDKDITQKLEDMEKQFTSLIAVLSKQLLEDCLSERVYTGFAHSM